MQKNCLLSIVYSLLMVIVLVGGVGGLNPLLAQEVFRASSEPVYATVLADKVNIRAGQGLNFETLGQLNKADLVLVLSQEYDWYKIRLPKQALCFVHQDYVANGIVTANKLRVRAGEGMNFNVLGMLEKGQIVHVLQKRGDWLRIEPTDNCSGWVKKEYLALSSKPVSPPCQSCSAQKNNKIEVQGTINDLGKIVNRPGTHKLVAGNKVLYYLNSKNIDLNLYIYQKVCVIGELIEAKESTYPVIDVQQIMVKQ